MVDNAAIAELLIREAETAEGHREQAFRRAAHAAFMWSEEGTDIAAAGRLLTELAGIGHSLAKRLHNWIASPPEVEVPAIRREFLTLAHARRVLKKIREMGAATLTVILAQTRHRRHRPEQLGFVELSLADMAARRRFPPTDHQIHWHHGSHSGPEPLLRVLPNRK